ncbi:MAG: ribonuclease Z [Saprospiraceae bacterium]|nr:ribonuclease Z [Saprospiraceae bacterium]MDW8483545.1 ribonuclease Z [Saprospiraceae bacterium]
MWVRILGNGSGGPFRGRHYSAQVVHDRRHYFLVDCGEGAQEQLHRYEMPVDRIQQIFITHLHGDHVFGLLGLLTSYSLKNREQTLQLFSPPGLAAFVFDAARHCGIRFSFPLEFIEVGCEHSEHVFETKAIEVWTIPLRHGTPCVGWLFREKPRPRNIRPECIERYGLSFAQIRAIKEGADLILADERIVPNEELTLPAKPLRSYAYCSDTAPSEEVADVVRGVSLLYHEATFTSEHEKEAAEAFHSTARQAAEIASAAQAGQLLLGHFSGRYPDTTRHLCEAREIFPNTEVSVEGIEYAVGE